MIKKIHTDKWKLAYAAPLWSAGTLGLCFLCAGLALLNVKLIILGIFSVFLLGSDIVYFAKNYRLFLVTLILQIVCNSILIAVGFYYYYIVHFLIAVMIINLVWVLSFFFYFYLIFFVKKVEIDND